MSKGQAQEPYGDDVIKRLYFLTHEKEAPYTKIFAEVYEAYGQDLPLVEKNLRPVINYRGLDVRDYLDPQIISRDGSEKTAIVALRMFVEIMRLVRELQFVGNSQKSWEDACKLEQERTKEARTMVDEALELAPWLRAQLRQHFREEIHSPPDETD